METYIPYYHRKPNKFIRYEQREFDDGHGHFGIEIIAIYLDKHNKQREETAQVIWSRL